MRGYRALRNSGDLQRMTALKQALTQTPLRRVEGGSSPVIYGAATATSELVTRQYALARYAGTSLNQAVLSSLGGSGSPVAHPMPAEWCDVLEEHGFVVARGMSGARWGLRMVLHLGSGALDIARQAAAEVRALGRSADLPARYSHFHALTPGTLPQPGPDGRSHDIITWYCMWRGAAGLDAISHDLRTDGTARACGLPVHGGRPFTPPLHGVGEVARFLGWSAAAIALATVDLLRGRWWHALLLREAIAAARVRRQPAQRLAREYLFHNSEWIFRPLWTYEAERQGSGILLYFYSTNTEGFKQPTGYGPVTYGWGAASWPHYLVWDDAQAEFVRRSTTGKAKVEVVGSIWFHTSAETLPSAWPRSVAVFDVIPFRKSYYEMLGLDFEYYVPATSVPFLEDIERCAGDRGLSMLWKRKRHLGHRTHRVYRNLADRLARSPHVAVIDPDVSAVRLIEAADMAVSMPFTSTALLAREQGKPSCYYDPTRRIQKDDRAAHGIPIVSGIEELQEWIAAHAVSLPEALQPVAQGGR